MIDPVICPYCNIKMQVSKQGVCVKELFMKDKEVYRIWHADLLRYVLVVELRSSQDLQISLLLMVVRKIKLENWRHILKTGKNKTCFMNGGNF